jgi:DNA-binding LacI/PurR family transcriptional regulator/DNA-binding transcriptional regulator YhcF (GntR family)
MKMLVDYEINEQVPVPKYEQLRGVLLDYITHLPLDVEYLPYEYEIEEALKISKRTIRRALDGLREDGIIETSRKRGSKILRRDFATKPEPALIDSPFKDQVIASLFVSNIDAPTRTAYRPWQITAELEEAIGRENGSVFVCNLREKQWHDRRAVIDSLRSAGVEWAFLYHHEDNNTEELVTMLTEAGIKTAIHVGSFAGLKELGYLLENCDYILTNHNLAIHQSLNEKFTGIDCLIYAGFARYLDWEQPRIEVCANFADKQGIPFKTVIKDVPEAEPKGGNEAFSLKTDHEIGLKCVDEIIESISACQNPLCFAANDLIASGIMAGLREQDVAIPEALSLVGYDNRPEMRSSNLSTFDFNARQIANELLELFADFLTDRERSRHQVLGRMVAPKLILRATTRLNTNNGDKHVDND